MELLCKYYSNKARLANSVQYLSNQPSFRFFCVSGMIVKNKRNFEVITDTVSLVVGCVLPNTGKSSMMLFTSDPALRDMDGKEVDPSTLEYDPVFYNLCLLLQAKCRTTKNPVTVEFRNDEVVVAVSITAEEGTEMQCTVRGPSGDLVVHGTQNIRSTLKQCKMFHSFRYVTSTDECQREVTIKRNRESRGVLKEREPKEKGRTGILQEISRYLNRTLVLVSFMPDGSLLEQYVSGSGLLEVTTRSDNTRIYRKVLDQRLREASAFCVYQTTCKIDEVLREQGRALHVARA